MAPDILEVFSKFSKTAAGNQTNIVPTATQLWETMDIIHCGLLFSAIFASLLVLILFVIQIRYVIKYTSNENIRSSIYFILLIPLITCCSSVVGMAMPRSAAFLFGATVCYYMIVLYINVTLMQAMFGGRMALRRNMHKNRKKIKLAVYPYWCCLTCLPKIEPTINSFRVCEGLILQSIILRIVLQIMEICVYYEIGKRDHIFFTISHALGFISMWIAFYMVYVLIDLGKDRLQPYKYKILFQLTDIAQTLCFIQKFGIDALVIFGLIPATNFFPATSAGNFYFNCLWCWEMLILSAVAMYIFQPSKTLLFDRYHASTTICSTDTLDSSIQQFGLDFEQEQMLDQYEAKKRQPTAEPSAEIIEQIKQSSTDIRRASSLASIGSSGTSGSEKQPVAVTKSEGEKTPMINKSTQVII